MTLLPTTRIDSISTNVNVDDPQDILLVDFVPNGTSSTSTSNNHESHHHVTNTPTSPHAHDQVLSFHRSSYPTGGLNTNPHHDPYTQHQSSNNPNKYHHPYGNNSNTTNNIFLAGHHTNPNSSHSVPASANTTDITNFTLVNLSNQPEHDDDDDENQHLCEQEGVGMTASSSVGNHQKQHFQLKRSSMQLGNGGAFPIQGKASSSLSSSSSSNDSDTGFLVPQNNGIKGAIGKDKNYSQRVRRNNHIDAVSVMSPSYPGSPGFQPSHRKKLRRRRTSGGRRKSDQRHSIEQNDAFSACCCFGEDDPNQANQGLSLTSKYLRFSCFIVMIIAITTFASIVVSLQRKVDSLSWEVKKLSAAGSPMGSLSPNNTSDQDNRNLNASMLQDLILKQDQINASLTSLKTMMDEVSQKVLQLEKQPSVEEVRQNLARLGSDLEGSIKELKHDFENYKNSNGKPSTQISDGESVPGESKVPADSATTSSNGSI